MNKEQEGRRQQSWGTRRTVAAQTLHGLVCHVRGTLARVELCNRRRQPRQTTTSGRGVVEERGDVHGKESCSLRLNHLSLEETYTMNCEN